MIGQAMPSFWLALILMIALALAWPGWPSTSSMPGIVLAFSAIPALTRLTRRA